MSLKRLLLSTRYRTAIVESLYVEHLHTSTRFLSGLLEDKEILLDYAGQVICETDPLMLASGISPENQHQFLGDLAEKWLVEPSTIFVTDCFEVFGVGAGRIIKKLGKKRSLELNEDYCEQIANSTALSDEGKFLRTFLDELHSFVPNFLPDSCEEYFQVDMVNLHPDYQGAGIGYRLVKEMLRLAKKLNLQYVVIGCTSSKIKRICEKFNLHSKFAFPYLKFVSNGEPVFGEQLVDESTEAHLMIADLNEISNLLADEPPRLPNAYKLPKTQRELVDEIYVDRLGRTIRYEIALPEDEPVVRDYMTNEYYRQTNIPRTLQCRKEDITDLITRFHPEVLHQGNAILAIDKGHLCGLSINREILLKETASTNKNIEIPTDFTPLIDAQPYTHIGVKTLRAINAWMESYVSQLLPPDCDKFYMLNTLTVHPDYRGCKIANVLWAEALKLAHRKGIRYVQCMCSAIGSNKVAENVGLKMAISLPYSKVTYNGQMLFENGMVNDQGELFSMYMGDLNEIFGK